jgi:adenylate cyclase class IV
MSGHSYEIEIKSLLGNKESADKLLASMKEKDPGLVEVGTHKQLNHYFVGGDLKKLYENVKEVIEPDKKDILKNLVEKAKDFSLRTRWADGKVILVIKASVDDTTSSNGTARLEWESAVTLLLPKEEYSAQQGEVVGEKNIDAFNKLDNLVLKSGFAYQAKWSRERQEFLYHPGHREISVSIDKNAGYGYLSEFEVVVNDESKADEVKSFIRETMSDLGIEELPQDRLARMFDFYNKNWGDYYGTDKIFNIE